jgi:hypothetical protein
MSFVCSCVRYSMNRANVGIFQFVPKRHLPEWKLETYTMYYGPSLAKIVRISCFSCVDLSILSHNHYGIIDFSFFFLFLYRGTEFPNSYEVLA